MSLARSKRMVENVQMSVASALVGKGGRRKEEGKGTRRARKEDAFSDKLFSLGSAHGSLRVERSANNSYF